MELRILHIVTTMNAGGIETMIMNLYRNINRDSIQFDFLVHRKEEGFYDKEIKNLGGKIYFLGRFNSLFKYNNRLIDFLNSKDYSIIHSHINQYSYFPLKVAKKANIPIRISHSHQYLKTNKTVKRFRIPIIYYCRNRLRDLYTHGFACSEQAGRWLFGKDASFKVINNSIDAKAFIYNEEIAKNKKEELGLSENFVIGHIGNFSPVKNYPFILKIFKKVVGKNSKAKLMLIGDHLKNPEIKNRVSELGMGNSVLFMGVRSDIPELLQAMDVFLFPSITEGLPVSMIEAQAAGLPCIMSDSITDEVKITNLVKTLSLNKTAEFWAEEILKYYTGFERKNTFKQICESGYDVKENTKKLEMQYKNMYEQVR